SIFTDQAPKAIGPYSQAVRAGNTVYLSGQIPLDPRTGELVAGDIKLETRRVFDNLKAVTESGGGGLKDVARATIFLPHFVLSPTSTRGRPSSSPRPIRPVAPLAVAPLPRGPPLGTVGVLAPP